MTFIILNPYTFLPRTMTFNCNLQYALASDFVFTLLTHSRCIIDDGILWEHLWLVFPECSLPMIYYVDIFLLRDSVIITDFFSFPDRSLPFVHVRWATCISFSLNFAVLQVDWVLRGLHQYARRQHHASTRVHHPGNHWLKTGSLTLRLGIRWPVNAVAYLRLLLFSHTPGSAQKRR